MWHTPILRQWDTDVRTAESLAQLPEEYTRADVDKRVRQIEDLQQHYSHNRLAVQEFAPFLETLRERKKHAPSYIKSPAPAAPILPSASVSPPLPSIPPVESFDVLPSVVSHQEGHLTVYETNPAFLHETPSASLEVRVTEQHFGTINMMDKVFAYFASEGVIGEQKNIMLATICLASGLHIGIEGPSGSGKSKIANTLIDLVSEQDVYRLELATDTVLMNDVNAINQRKVLYIPELQKAYRRTSGTTPMIAEIVKTLTEGRDAVRKVTLRPGDVASYTINAGITVVYTIADENPFKKDIETARRFIRLETDTSEEHKGAIRQAKADEAFSKKQYIRDEVLHVELREFMSYLLQYRTDIEVADPFAEYMTQYIPLTQRFASFQAHYNDLVAAAARFNHNRRIATHVQENIKTIFVTLEDHKLIYDCYYTQMLGAMELIDTAKQDVQKIQEMREHVQKQGINWEACFAAAQSKMQNAYSSLAQQWEEQCLETKAQKE